MRVLWCDEKWTVEIFVNDEMHDADIMRITIHIYVMIIQVLFSFGEVRST